MRNLEPEWNNIDTPDISRDGDYNREGDFMREGNYEREENELRDREEENLHDRL